MSPRIGDWQAGGSFATIGTHRYFVRRGGSGPVLLLLHGYPVGSYDWHAIWPHLQAHFTLIAPDMLGHGFSDKPPNGDYSVQAHAALHDALLMQLGVAECHIVAFDLGVSVAQEMLARRLEQPQRSWPRIKSLVLLNGGLCPKAYQPRLIQRLLVSPMGGWIAARVNQHLFEKPISRMYGDTPAPSKELLEDFWAFVNLGNGRQVAHRVGAFWKSRMAHSERLIGALLHSGVRLRLINGAADPNSGAHMVRAFLQHQPQADVVSLKTLGHWPHIQDPVTVARHLLTFVKGGAQAVVLGCTES